MYVLIIYLFVLHVCSPIHQPYPINQFIFPSFLVAIHSRICKRKATSVNKVGCLQHSRITVFERMPTTVWVSTSTASEDYRSRQRCSELLHDLNNIAYYIPHCRRVQNCHMTSEGL